MIKTIFAFSDIHLRPLTRHVEYQEQFNKIILEIERIKPDRVVIAGDIFHAKITITNELSQMISKLFKGIIKYSKLIIIPGNHDAIIDSPRLDSISPIIEMLDKEEIVYYKNSGVYIDKWDKSFAWAVWSCLEGQASPEIKEFKCLNKDIHQYIGLFHGVINGSTTDLGFTFTEEGVDVAEFYETDIFIAGDIHKHQTYNYKNYKDTGFGIMCGSAIQNEFGEQPENHGYVLLTYKNGKWDFKLNEIPTDYGYYTIFINSVEEIENL